MEFDRSAPVTTLTLSGSIPPLTLSLRAFPSSSDDFLLVFLRAEKVTVDPYLADTNNIYTHAGAFGL